LYCSSSVYPKFCILHSAALVHAQVQLVAQVQSWISMNYRYMYPSTQFRYHWQNRSKCRHIILKLLPLEKVTQGDRYLCDLRTNSKLHIYNSANIYSWPIQHTTSVCQMSINTHLSNVTNILTTSIFQESVHPSGSRHRRSQ
jgi:hypothetical protein